MIIVAPMKLLYGQMLLVYFMCCICSPYAFLCPFFFITIYSVQSACLLAVTCYAITSVIGHCADDVMLLFCHVTFSANVETRWLCHDMTHIDNHSLFTLKVCRPTVWGQTSERFIIGVVIFILCTPMIYNIKRVVVRYLQVDECIIRCLQFFRFSLFSTIPMK